MRASRYASGLLVAALVLAFDIGASAHRYDEFLQAARIGVGSERVIVELSLTPGIAAADAVVREIDADGDAVLSSVEQREYAERVMHRITLGVDDYRPLRLALADSSFPDPDVMRTGDAAIALRLEAWMPRLGGGVHRLVFRNDHATAASVYLANALVPDNPEIMVTGQRRDYDQRELAVDFTLGKASLSAGGWGWIGFACALLLAAMLARRAERACAQPKRVL